MIIPRSLDLQALRDDLTEAPAVVLLGPRQVGKTTLAHAIHSSEAGSIYLDLETAADLRRLDDPAAFLATTAGRLTILDEVHRVPMLFAELRSEIDRRRRAGHRTGQFLLLGSASIDLIQKASESLAGRVVYREVRPFGPTEAAIAGHSIDTLWVRGGFPESLLAKDSGASSRWRSAFIRSYLERDVPMFAPRVAASMIGRLWTMLAHGQGNMLNHARLAQALAVSAPTVARYIDLLEDLLLVRRLRPWSGNTAKRLVRTPKVFIRDSGLVHSLLEISDLHTLLGHPVVGASWEGFVIETLIHAAGAERTPYFFRTHDGAEIDLVLERAGKPEIAIEIKRSSAPMTAPGFAMSCDALGAVQRWCVAPVAAAYPMRDGIQAMPVEDAARRLAELPSLNAGSG